MQYLTKQAPHATSTLNNQLSSLYTIIGWNTERLRTPELCRKILDGSVFYTCTFNQNNLIGFARIMGDGVFGQIMDVITHPDHRQKGIAGNNIRTLIEYAEEENYLGLSLIDGSGKHGFYSRFGFTDGGPGNQVMYLEL